MSPGGVHSHQDHIAKIAQLASAQGIKVWVHAFLDGRDVPPKSAGEFIVNFEKNFSDDPNVKIATTSGRYFAGIRMISSVTSLRPHWKKLSFRRRPLVENSVLTYTQSVFRVIPATQNRHFA